MLSWRLNEGRFTQNNDGWTRGFTADVYLKRDGKYSFGTEGVICRYTYHPPPHTPTATAGPHMRAAAICSIAFLFRLKGGKYVRPHLLDSLRAAAKRPEIGGRFPTPGILGGNLENSANESIENRKSFNSLSLQTHTGCFQQLNHKLGSFYYYYYYYCCTLFTPGDTKISAPHLYRRLSCDSL